MKALAFFISCALFINTIDGFFFWNSGPEWDGLRVTWGLNPFTSFSTLPRTKSAAISAGWIKFGDDSGCAANNHFRGERYWKNDDLAVLLIFDPSGYIAGIQAGIPQSYTPNHNNYPFGPLRNTAFILENGIYFITAYFVDPATLCSSRTAVQFRSQGTGNGLWIQNGTDPAADSIAIPMTQTEAETSKWTKGACFYTMGHHFWYNATKDMSCDTLYPVFLMYNDGKLNSFGWAFGMEITTSSRFENPPRSSYRHFMNVIPDCLYDLGTLTTMHIYMTDSPRSNFC